MGGMTIADLRFSAGQKLPSHAHELATITVTMDGNFETLIEGRAYQNPLHAVLCKPQGSMHGNAFGRTAVRVVMLSIDGDGDEFRPCARSLRDVVHAIDPRAGALAAGIAAELAEPDDLTPLALAGLSREMMAAVARLEQVPRGQPRPLWLRRGLEFVHGNITSSVGLSAVAQVAGVHPIYFARAFRVHLGDSLGGYVRKLRVQRAAARLGSSDEPIAEIAVELGFSDQSHLTRIFRTITGYTPASYRKLCRA